MKRFFLIPVALSTSLLAQNTDAVLINGKIVTADAAFSLQQAVAVNDGKIAAVGTTAQIRKLAGTKTKVIDLGGRTVIPGLIDSHIHAIRAASFFATETNWAGVPTLAEALERIRSSAKAKRPGEWIIVGGRLETRAVQGKACSYAGRIDRGGGGSPCLRSDALRVGFDESARLGRAPYTDGCRSSGRGKTRP